MLQQPLSTEYPSYYHKYICLLPDTDMLEYLQKQMEIVCQLVDNLSEEQLLYRYDEDKWSLKEVLGHIMDTERVFHYRMMRIARGDTTPLAGFNEEDYVNHANFDQRSIQDIRAEYVAVRQSTLSLARSLTDTAWMRIGVANNGEVSSRALLYMIAGHEMHHLHLIRERYLHLC